MARTPGAEALREALSSLERSGEAPRIGLLGNTGAGKTRAAEEIVRGYLRCSSGLVIVVDAKANRRYDGVLDAARVAVRESVSDVRARPLLPGTRVLIFRSPIFKGVDADPNAIAELSWSLAGSKTPTLTVNDELVPHCADYGQWVGGKGGWVKRSFVQGREHGIGQLWCTTTPQGVPIEAFGQSRLWVFQLAGQDLSLLRRRNFLIGVPPGLVEELAGEPRPFEERGEFVCLLSGRPWDGRIYKF
ncbi:MAG TPA: hypothetical protein VN646_16895 [Candidatus Acidoferrum sp.]|nr:hypothetical protein [Candidatus Acidoferrum sp.]